MYKRQLLQCLAIFTVVTLSALALINSRWLISIHATAAASTWLIFTLVFGTTVGLVVLPVTVLILSLIHISEPTRPY